MKITTHNAVATIALALVSQPVDAFWRMSCGLIQTARIDPVVSYGGIANHVHKIAGGSAININSTYDSMQESECTSCTIQADKSAYWTPALYYQRADGKFEEVPNSGMTVYYLGRGLNANGSPIAQPFPKGLKMLSGNNLARSQDMTTMTWGNKTYPPRLVSEAVSFVCINYANETGSETHGMQNMNCPQGFRAQIQMQSCWDGVNLYKSDQSHVAHLNQIDNGACPPTHPILLPHLFYEVFYSVDTYVGGTGKFMFANGDMTGYGFHGDFFNGWDIPTLQSAISTCLIGNVNGVTSECKAFAASNNENAPAMCPERSPIIPCEPVHGTIDKLPGCINGTGLGAVVTAASVTCPGGNAASCASVYNNTAPLPYAGDSSYASLGCYTEATSSRALKDKSWVSTTNMTAAACIAFCGGSQYAAVEWSQECYCGSTIQTGSVPASKSDCSMSCTGNQWEICGGPSRLNIFKKIGAVSASSSSTTSASSTTSSTAATSTTTKAFSTKYPNPASIGNSSIGTWANKGCWTDNTSGRVLQAGSTYGSFQGSAPMTLEMCGAYCGKLKSTSAVQFFGVEYGQECYCGITLAASSVFAANQDDCSMKCPGNSSQSCGAGDRLNVYSLVSAPASSASTSSTSVKTSSSSSSTASTSKATSTSASTSTSVTSAPALNAVASSTSSTATPTASILACPASNGTIYTATSGKSYMVECYNDHAGGDLSPTNMVYVNSLVNCIAACDSTKGCVAYSWVSSRNGVNNPCYMKGTIGANGVNSGVWGGKFVASSTTSTRPTATPTK